jgi:hypothetical protein
MGLAFTDEGERRLAGAPPRRGGVQGSQQLPVADAGFELGLDVALEVLQQPQFQNARLCQGGIGREGARRLRMSA